MRYGNLKIKKNPLFYTCTYGPYVLSQINAGNRDSDLGLRVSFH